MIQKITGHFVRGLTVARSHRDYLYTLGLLIVVPLAFLWSGQEFLTIARQHAEQAERSRIGLLHDSLSSLYIATGETAILRRMVTDIGELNPDLTHLAVVSLEESGLSPEVFIGSAFTADEYIELIRIGGLSRDESMIIDVPRDGVRHWVGVRAIPEDGPIPTKFIITDVSLERSDAFFSAQVREAYIFLGAIIIVLMLLIARQARIINYASLYRELKKALEAKTAFINMTAHELRAPLTALRGYSSMIREDATSSANVKEYAARTEESAAYLIKLVTDLLDIAKLQSGNMKIDDATVSVTELLKETVNRLEPLGKEHAIGILLEPISEDLHITVDRTRFEEILTNLISNAVKYTKEGKVSVSAERLKGRAEIRIKDTGIGMSAEDRDKLFTPYFRAAEAEEGKTVGTGLGLWITKQFIEAMKGTVSVESIHGVGTHIVVSFPLEKKTAL